MDVNLIKKWNVGKLLKTPMCVVPLIFAPCSYVWAADDEIMISGPGSDPGIARPIEDETYSNSMNGKYALQVLSGANVTAKKVVINSSGINGFGALIKSSQFKAQDLSINVSGSGGTGILLENNSVGNVVLNNLQVIGSGNAKGLVMDSGAAVVNGGTVSTDAATAVTVTAGSLSMDSVKITTQGNESIGVNGKTGTATLSNSTIETQGDNSTGLYTENDIKGKALSVTTHGNGAAGLAVKGGSGTLTGGKITTHGELAAALASYNGATITADGVDINTTGVEGYGALVREGTLDIRNSKIATANEKASGVYVGGLGAGSSNITLDRVTVNTQQAQAIEVDIAQAVMNVNNSVLTGGAGKVLTVKHYNDADESYNVYSNLALNVQNSTLNGDITVSDIRNTVAVDLSSASVLNGAVTKASSLSIDASSKWNMSNASDVGQLTNNGRITFSNQRKFDILTVTGNYAGDGGLLVMNSVLGDDSSQTNKLIVGGDVLAGTTRVAINNLGGKGAQTVEGIEIVEVGGTSEGTFKKADRIVAGAYDYDLVQKGENWYLTSQLSPVDTRKPSVIRPEGGSYTANQATANTMFLLTLHDRLGETQFIDALTGQKEVTSLWLRQVGGHNTWHDASGQMKTQSNRYVAQIGGDVARWSTDGLDRWHVGLMAGYGDSHSTTRNQHSGYRSKGSVNGYSVGGYATWYANEETHTGAHLDSWLQYGWFNNNVKGENLATESYKSNGISASLEGGYTWKLGQFSGSHGSLNEWFIQPQAQIVWMGVKTDNVQEANGTKVKGEGDGNLQTRLGVKTYLKGHHAIDNDKQREFQPFLQLNWLHNTRNFATKMDDVRVSQNGATNLAEVKVGLEGKVNPRLNLWGNIGVQMGDAGYNDNAAMVGVKYNF